MQQKFTAIMFLGTALFGQEAVVQRSTIWTDTVKRGDMNRMVRGLGVLKPNRAAELRIAETQSSQIRSGQAVVVDTHQGIVNGKVARVDPAAVNGTILVEVQLEGDSPAAARPGQEIDGIIHVETLKDVIYVGRPVFGSTESEGTLFKLEPDRQHATKVKVQYGRSAVNTIEVRSGLQPGDQVILSDMSPFAARDRIRLQ